MNRRSLLAGLAAAVVTPPLPTPPAPIGIGAEYEALEAQFMLATLRGWVQAQPAGLLDLSDLIAGHLWLRTGSTPAAA